MASEGRNFSEIDAVISKRLQVTFGWDQQMIEAVTDAVCFAIANEFGGRAHYVPKRNRAMYARIKDEFNGRNIQSLSQKYSVSCSTVRRLVCKK